MTGRVYLSQIGQRPRLAERCRSLRVGFESRAGPDESWAELLDVILPGIIARLPALARVEVSTDGDLGEAMITALETCRTLQSVDLALDRWQPDELLQFASRTSITRLAMDQLDLYDPLSADAPVAANIVRLDLRAMHIFRADAFADVLRHFPNLRALAVTLGFDMESSEAVGSVMAELVDSGAMDGLEELRLVDIDAEREEPDEDERDWWYTLPRPGHFPKLRRLAWGINEPGSWLAYRFGAVERLELLYPSDGAELVKHIATSYPALRELHWHGSAFRMSQGLPLLEVCILTRAALTEQQTCRQLQVRLIPGLDY